MRAMLEKYVQKKSKKRTATLEKEKKEKKYSSGGCV